MDSAGGDPLPLIAAQNRGGKMLAILHGHYSGLQTRQTLMASSRFIEA